MKIGIIGTGSIGLALGRLWAQSGHEVRLSFSRAEQKVRKADTPLAMPIDMDEAATRASTRSLQVLVESACAALTIHGHDAG